MAIRYVDSNTIMDLGEKIRFKSKVEPVCGVDIPFSIISADYELIFVDTDAETETVEDQGNCNINEHTLSTYLIAMSSLLSACFMSAETLLYKLCRQLAQIQQ